MTMPYGEQLTIVVRTSSGTDADGNDVPAEDMSLVRPGAFDPAIGFESTNGRDQVSSQPQALFTGQAAVDVAAVISSTSAIQRANGDRYEVDGEPGDWSHPSTGWHAGLQVPLKRVTG